MRILVIDPSESHSGVVLIQNDKLSLAATFTQWELLKWLVDPALAPIQKLWIEVPALGESSDHKTIISYFILLKAAEERFKGVKVTKFYPGVWKPISLALGWSSRDYPDLSDQHQKDAFCIYKYGKWMENAKSREQSRNTR